MPQPPVAGTPISRYRDLKKSNSKTVGMLIQGDSWFAFPMWLRTNIVAELKRFYDNKIVQLDLSTSGDEVRAMMSGDEFAEIYRIMAQENLQFDAILFSGGGNDIVSTNLPVLLKPYQKGYTWQDCLNLDRYNRRLQEIKNAYLDLADLRDDHQPNAWIFTHGYDFATPSGKGVYILGIEAAGGWIQEIMNNFKIPLPVQQGILDHMLSQFDAMLASLEQTENNWRHVRTQGTLAAGDWGDELHPSEDGFKKIAAKFERALEGVFPKLAQA
jgi:hypothetical protein